MIVSLYIFHIPHSYYTYSSYLNMKSTKPERKAKKVINWGKGMVVFVTTEAKKIGWDDRTLVAVSIDDSKGEKSIKIEKIGKI